MNSIRRAFILGAGYGTRLRPWTEQNPKPLVPLFQKTIIEYLIDFLKQNEIYEILINTHHQSEEYAKVIGDGHHLGVSISYNYEPRIMDTGGGLKCVESFLKDEPFLMINGDIITEGDMRPLFQNHLKSNALATVLLNQSGALKNVAVHQNQVVDFRFTFQKKYPNLFSFTGMHLLSPEIFKWIESEKPISIIDVYLDLIRNNKPILYEDWSSHYWSDVGSVQELTKVHLDIIEQKIQLGHFVQEIDQQGSDRKYYRVGDKSHSKIAMIYDTEKKENRHFFKIQFFLKNHNIHVPQIDYADENFQFIVMQDLGNQSLYQYVFNSQKDWKSFYFKAMDQLIQLHQINDYQDVETLNPKFDSDLYQWEGDYFYEHYFQNISQKKISLDEKLLFDQELKTISDELLKQKQVMVHRDFQSQNIMVYHSDVYLIDFQGMRLGVGLYDLASLVWDPYVSLENSFRDELVEYYFKNQSIYQNPSVLYLCAIQRLMQALGAFGYLSLKKNKLQYKQYILPAVININQVLAYLNGFPNLKGLIFYLDQTLQSSGRI